MGKFKRLLIVVCIVLATTFPEGVQACWLVGGEMTYKWVGQDSFLVTFILYRDCNAVPASPQTITARCNTTGNIIAAVSIPKPPPIDITPVCPSSCTRCSSTACSFPYGVEKYVFSKLLVLTSAGSCCEIRLEWQTCCRECVITTGAANDNFYLKAILNRCLAKENSSPVFNSDPITILCKGNTYSLDLGAYDLDTDSLGKFSDSLSFELAPPLSANNTPIGYISPYTYDKPIYFWGFPNNGNPFPRGFHFDPCSGNLKFTPIKNEVTVMVVKVKEWRRINGTMTKIGEITRDVMYFVINSAPNKQPFILTTIPDQIDLCNNNTKVFNFSTFDSNLTDTVTLSYSGNLPFATFSANNGNVRLPSASLTIVPNSIPASNQYYQFTITATDNHCPLAGINSRTFLIRYLPSLDNISLKDSVIHCNTHLLSINSPDFFNIPLLWTIGSNPIVKTFGTSASYYTDGPGKYPVSISYDDTVICNSVFRDTITQDSLLYLERMKDLLSCYKEGFKADSVMVSANIKYNAGTVSYHWSTGDSSPVLKYQPNVTTSIILKVSDTSGCEAYDTFIVFIHPRPKISLGADQYHCFADTAILSANISDLNTINDSLAFYRLNQPFPFAKGINNVKVSDGGIFLAKIYNSYGCDQTDTVTINRSPEIKAAASNQAFCMYEKAVLMADSTGSKNSNTIYEWYDAGAGQLLHTGQAYPIIAQRDQVFRLVVKEWLHDKYCTDDSIVKIQMKKSLLNPKFPPHYCSYDSFLDFRQFIDTKQGNLWVLYPQTTDSHRIHITKVLKDADSLVVHFKENNTLCEWDSIIYLMLKPLPKVNLTSEYGERTMFCKAYGKIQLHGSPLGGKWYGGYVEPGYLFNTERPSGSYPVVYEYTDQNGCFNRDTIVFVTGETFLSIDKSDTQLCAGENYQAKALFGNAEKMAWYWGLGANGYYQGSIYKTETTYVPGYYDILNRGFWLAVKTIDNICPEIKDSIHIHIGAIPKAEFMADITEGSSPLTINFTDKSWLPYDQIALYEWDFGDGNKSILQNPSNRFYDSGFYDVFLKVTSNIGCSDSVLKNDFIYVYPLSVAENNGQSISLYPNPSSGTIILKTETIEMEKIILFNSLGMKVREINPEDPHFTKIERGDLEAGVYLLKASSIEGNPVIFKIIFD